MDCPFWSRTSAESRSVSPTSNAAVAGLTVIDVATGVGGGGGGGGGTGSVVPSPPQESVPASAATRSDAERKAPRRRAWVLGRRVRTVMKSFLLRTCFRLPYLFSSTTEPQLGEFRTGLRPDGRTTGDPDAVIIEPRSGVPILPLLHPSVSVWGGVSQAASKPFPWGACQPQHRKADRAPPGGVRRVVERSRRPPGLQGSGPGPRRPLPTACTTQAPRSVKSTTYSRLFRGEYSPATSRTRS